MLTLALQIGCVKLAGLAFVHKFAHKQLPYKLILDAGVYSYTRRWDSFFTLFE
jgi:hypothetical protein